MTLYQEKVDSYVAPATSTSRMVTLLADLVLRIYGKGHR